MKSLSRATSPEEFAYLLYFWMKKWRGSGSGNRSAANRFAKNVRRQYIRECKRRFRLSVLPSFAGTQAEGAEWHAEAAADVKIVFLPQGAVSEGLGENQSGMRRDMNRLLDAAMLRGSHANTDLIKSANSGRKRLPSVARSYFSGREQLRGLYLEALGVAILPALNPENIEALRSQGALVFENSLVSMEIPSGKVTYKLDPSLVWHLPQASNSLESRYTGKGVSIGILDTGIDQNHPEFHGKSIQFLAFSKNGLPAPHVACKDFGHHGTHVAGICSGLNVGIARDAHLSVAAVLTERLPNGRLGGFLAQIIGGLNWLTSQAGPDGAGVDVINASLGFNTRNSDDTDALYNAVFLARLQGKLTIAAIGNDGLKGLGKHSMPGKFDHVVAVGAIDSNDQIADFSDWGPAHASNVALEDFKPDIVAPGVAILSAVPNGGYMCMNGTSMATPQVTAAVARLIEADKSLRIDPDRLTNRLMGLTIPLLPPAHIDKRRVGKGRLDLAKI